VREMHQPPSGGCVLKLNVWGHRNTLQCPAAFGRLCVETGRTIKATA